MSRNQYNQFEMSRHTFTSGAVYEGYWKTINTSTGPLRVMDTTNGGKGKLVHTDGSMYEGQFKNNMKHGSGFMTWPGGRMVYSGDWKDDVAKGHGQFIWKDGESTVTYTGEVDSNAPGGVGTFKYQRHGKIYKVVHAQNQSSYSDLRSGCTPFIFEDNQVVWMGTWPEN